MKTNTYRVELIINGYIGVSKARITEEALANAIIDYQTTYGENYSLGMIPFTQVGKEIGNAWQIVLQRRTNKDGKKKMYVFMNRLGSYLTSKFLLSKFLLVTPLTTEEK